METRQNLIFPCQIWNLGQRGQGSLPRAGIEVGLLPGGEIAPPLQQLEWGGVLPAPHLLTAAKGKRTEKAVSPPAPGLGRGSTTRGPTFMAPPPAASRVLCPLQHLRLQVVFSILRLHVLCISDSLD